MHDLFADWCHDADPAATPEIINKRWAATDEVLKGLTKPQAADLARFATGRQANPPAILQAYKRHDETMRTRGVDEELRRMAAAVLHIACEQPPLAPVAALVLLCSAFGAATEPPWLTEHMRKAADTLVESGRDARGVSGPATVADPLNAAAVNSALVPVGKTLTTLAESNDCLWWALTQHSRVLKVPYKELSALLVALAAPLDLLSFARSVPMGPEAETLLLHTMAGAASSSDPPIALRNYFSGIPRDRVEALKQSLPEACSGVCPIMWLLRAVVDAKNWQEEFEQRFGFGVGGKFHVHAVALQHLRESCLARLYAE